MTEGHKNIVIIEGQSDYRGTEGQRDRVIYFSQKNVKNIR